MKKKVLVFWSVGFGGLVMAILIAVSVGAMPHEERNITLDLDVEPGVFYKVDSNFHVNLNSFNSQSFSYTSPYSELKKYHYLQFTDVDMGSQYQVLVEIIKDNQVLYQNEMLKGESLILELPWVELSGHIGEEFELKISIFPQVELGLVGAEKYDLGFNALQLVSDSFYARLRYASVWISNTPNYSLSSLNYWQKQKLPVTIALAVLIWLSLVLFCAWILKISNSHLMLFLMLLILPSSVLLVFNQWQLKQQASSIFEGESTAINAVDSTIKEFSHVFLNWLKENDSLKSVVVVQSYKSFEQSRLMYYLHSLNVSISINWQYVESLKARKGVESIYVIIPESIMRDCQIDAMPEFFQFGYAELVLNHLNYCVVKL